MGRILRLLAFGLVGAGVGGMVFFFAAGWEGWTVMAAGVGSIRILLEIRNALEARRDTGPSKCT
jgi:hypothetical protein